MTRIRTFENVNENGKDVSFDLIVDQIQEKYWKLQLELESVNIAFENLVERNVRLVNEKQELLDQLKDKQENISSVDEGKDALIKAYGERINKLVAENNSLKERADYSYKYYELVRKLKGLAE